MNPFDEFVPKFKADMELAGGHGRRRLWEVFVDFCELAYCSLAKPCALDTEQAEGLEKRYMEVVKKYDKKQTEAICRMLSWTIMFCENADVSDDFLGTIYEQSGFSDEKFGAQFFTQQTWES